MGLLLLTGKNYLQAKQFKAAGPCGGACRTDAGRDKENTLKNMWLAPPPKQRGIDQRNTTQPGRQDKHPPNGRQGHAPTNEAPESRSRGAWGARAQSRIKYPPPPTFISP